MKKYTSKINAIRLGLKKDFIKLVENHGDKGRLFTFDYCSDCGCELNGSTIDEIEVSGDNIVFYYNINTGEYDFFNSFSTPELASFFDDLVLAIEKEEKK